MPRWTTALARLGRMLGLRSRAAPPPERPRLYAYLDPRTALTTLHDGQLIFVDPIDEQLTPSIVALGLWEAWVERAIRRLVKPGHRVIEVGSNVGYHTLVMASLIGPTGRLDAFEANPTMVRLSRRSLETNGYRTRVDVHQKIVADQPGVLHLNLSSYAGGAGNIAENGWGVGEGSEVVECEAVRLDDVFPGEVVDFIRLDTEGAEVLILGGAMGILARSPTVKLCIEWHLGMLRARGDVEALIAALVGLGFNFWKIDPDGLLQVPPADLTGLAHCDLLVARALDD